MLRRYFCIFARYSNGMNAIKAFFRFLISPLFLINLVLAIGAFFLIFYLVQSGNYEGTRQDEKYHKSLPLVTGLEVTDAVSELKKRGFEVVVDSIFQHCIPGGTVLLQDPIPSFGKDELPYSRIPLVRCDTKDTIKPQYSGHKYKEGRRVYLKVISFLPTPRTVPDVVEMSRRIAEAKLTSAGFQYKVETRPHEHTNVLDLLYKGKKVKPGDKVPYGAKFTLVVGKGVNQATPVPDLTGLTIIEAKKRLSEANLIMSLAECEACANEADSSAAKIIKQSPYGGSESLVPVGSDITIWATMLEPDTNDGNEP